MDDVKSEEKKVTKSGVVYFILAFLFGHIGLHRFYVRDKVGGFIYLFFGLVLGPISGGVITMITGAVAIIDGLIHISKKSLEKEFGHLWK